MSRFTLLLVPFKRPQSLRSAGIALVAVAAIAGCSGGGGGSAVQPIAPNGSVPTATPTPVKSGAPTATPTPVKTPTPAPSGSISSAACTTSTVSASIGASGGSITNNAQTGTFTETAAAGTFTAATTVTLGYDSASNLAAPLAHGLHRLANGERAPMFTQGAGNTYVASFCTSFSGVTPANALSLSGAGGIVPSNYPAGTQLNIALFQSGTWVDVGTALVTATGVFQSTPPTVALPGINQAGTYLVYVPAPGTNNTQINLGFALVADDSTANVTNGLQFVQVEDANGNALPTPTTTYYPVSGGDLDGQSLTPDASHGAIVDGGNTVYFFSGIPQHAFTLAANTVDITNYGGDGDSIASLPGGDEVVVSGDDGAPLAVISGILSGNPVIADTIPNPNQNYRDGLVISADGKVLLSRGQFGTTPGIDVYDVTPTAAHAGSTGAGTTSFSFTLVKTLVSGTPGSISTPIGEDGRDGMAISPADSSRAVVVGSDPSGNPTIQLITGLTSASPVVSSLPLRVPFVARHLGNVRQAPEPSAHRRPFAVTPTSGTELYAVAITPDGTTAYVSTDAGIITISGVNTGTLAQAGSVYAPTLTVQGSTCPLTGASTIGVLPDGKYLIADLGPDSTCVVNPGTTNTTQGSAVLVTVPIGAGHALGAPVGQLNQVVGPFNDQMITH